MYTSVAPFQYLVTAVRGCTFWKFGNNNNKPCKQTAHLDRCLRAPALVTRITVIRPNAPVLQVCGSVEASMAASGSLAGSCMWMLAARSYPDYDGYTLHLPLEPVDGGAAAAAAAAGDLDTIAEVRRHAQLLRAAAVQ
jgi:hypothetical protein